MNKRLFALILLLFWLAAFTLPTAAEETSPLTPDGNLTITDDILIENKQFITVHSRSGTEFYIIIDRSRESDNVYFLNQVDDIDLFALRESEDIEAECTCKEKYSTNAVNTDCLICRVNIESCAGKEVAQTVTAIEPEPEKPEKQQNYLPIILIFLLIVGGAAVYFLKLRKNKNKTSEPDLDVYDDDEYEETKNDNTEGKETRA